MKAVITPSKLKGEISVPPSKSYTHRAIILASLADGNSTITNALISDDTKATINACRLLGTKISVKGSLLEIIGTSGKFPKFEIPLEINCGQSGTTIRFMTAVSSLSASEVILTGDKRLRERPIGELIQALESSGVDITATNSNTVPPIFVKNGKYLGGNISISSDKSSQFISALLLISPYAVKDVEIAVKDFKSAPYVDITIDMMKTFGVEVSKVNNAFKIKASQKYLAQKYTVEGDHSSASYFLAAEALTGSKVTLNNLNPESVQGDKYFLEILKKMKSNHINNIELDLENYPDIVPTVCIVAANTKGITTIKNIGHLRLKETDRINALACELRKMSVAVKTTKDSISINGGKLKGANIDTYNDHRIAMSFAIAGLVADGETTINNAEVVNKSYPDFWKDLKKLGAKIDIFN